MCKTNVHPVLKILTRRGNFVLSFLIFIYFSTNFSAERFKKKSRRARPGRGPAEPPAHLRVLLLEHAGRRRRVRHGHPDAAPCPLLQAPLPPLYKPRRRRPLPLTPPPPRTRPAPRRRSRSPKAAAARRTPPPEPPLATPEPPEPRRTPPPSPEPVGAPPEPCPDEV